MAYLQPIDYRLVQRNYLLETARILSQDLSLERILAEILRVATGMLQAEGGLIALRTQSGEAIGSENGPFRVWSHFQVPEKFLEEIDDLLLNSTNFSQDPSTVVLAEIRHRLSDAAARVNFDLSGSMGLPLQVKNHWVGILLVFRAYRAPFTADDRVMLDAFRNQAAVAINNARLFEQVNQERSRLNAILEGSADGIFLLDVRHQVVRWNKALARLTGFLPEQVVGKPYENAIQWQGANPLHGLLEARNAGWPFTPDSSLYVEGVLQGNGGKGIEVGITFAPIFDEQNRLVNIIGNVRDITRFREAERLKSTFISIVSHELKTPVSLIKGYAGTLRRKDANWNAETIEQGLQVIEEEADRLANLIEDLLDASRLQAGGLRLQMNAVSLPAIVQSVVDSFAGQGHSHKIEVDFPSNFPYIQGDEDRLRQVLVNLLSNAIKYDPSGGTIRIKGVVQPRSVLVSVSDEGAGIPAEDIERVFDRFYRAPTPVTQRAQGAGLGLYLARAIIDAHNGQIWARSNRRKGTAFYFSLPRPSQISS
ncbi:MAG TPA: ATP-binding protein [Anaerolineales bacterium]|nr:ATP-binding protein [Anaerolineales bacterium]